MKAFNQVLIRAAQKAGSFQRKNFGRLKRKDVKRKKHGEYVTYVDQRCCRLIINEIKKHFPDHGIVSEEMPAVAGKSDYTWYIDPLDGTTNYSINNPLFGVAIAVTDKDNILESVVFLPVLGQMYYAQRGRGAFMNDKKIHVSSQQDIGRSIITISFPHNLSAAHRAMHIFNKIRPDVANIRIFGSGYYAFCSVASGCVEALIMPGSVNPWDSLAGILLVQEAGGLATNFSGQKSAYQKNLLISNKKIHQQILKKLK